jgi:hypothetical protein
MTHILTVNSILVMKFTHLILNIEYTQNAGFIVRSEITIDTHTPVGIDLDIHTSMESA